MRKIKDYLFSLNGILLFLFTVVLGAYLIGMPKYIDDNWFMMPFVKWYHSQGIFDTTNGGNIVKSGIPWRELVDEWQYRYENDNGRLGNILVFIFLLFPKWLGSSVALLAWIIAMYISLKFSQINLKSPLIGLAIILWGIFVPWPSHMGSMVYQFNYVVATGVILLYLKYLHIFDISFEAKSYYSRKNKGVVLICSFLFGLVVGWWHESFSTSVFIALCVLLIKFKDCRNLKVYSSLIGLGIGIIILAVAPGTRVRMEMSDMSFTVKIIHAIIYNIPYYIFLVLFGIEIITRGSKKIFNNKILVFCLICGIVPITLSFITFAASRVTWWTQIIAIIGILYILNKRYFKYWQKYKFGNLIWLIPLLVFVFARFIYLDYYAIQTRKLISESVRSYLKHPDQPVFASVITSEQIPFYCALISDVVLTNQIYGQALFLSEWTGDEGFKIIPVELKSVTERTGRPLSGIAGAREYNNLIFIPAENAQYHDYQVKYFEVDYGIWKRHVTAFTFRFTSDADNNEYVYINLMSPWPEKNLIKPKGLKEI